MTNKPLSKKSKYIDKKYGWLNPNDVVFTPDDIAQKIVKIFNPSGKILEPCSGEGAFLKFLPLDTEWCEITEGRDFFEWTSPKEIVGHWDWIVTNPPYSDFDKFLKRSFEVADNVVFLVPLAKIFKSMGTLRVIKSYGGIVKMWILSASQCGFPFGFPAAAVHFKRGYNGQTVIEIN